ncbi:hypothetical protein KIPB_016440, partial [Kipferlia bialata]
VKAKDRSRFEAHTGFIDTGKMHLSNIEYLQRTLEVAQCRPKDVLALTDDLDYWADNYQDPDVADIYQEDWWESVLEGIEANKGAEETDDDESDDENE